MNAVHVRRCSAGLALAAASAMVLTVPLAAAQSAPAVVDFFRTPAMLAPVVSPSGGYAAALVAGTQGGRMRLAVIDLRDPTKSALVAAFADADIKAVHWVNDDRLVFSVIDAQSPGGSQWGEGLYAVDRQGKEAARRLIKRRQLMVTEATHLTDRELSVYHRLRSVLRDGSNDVVVMEYSFTSIGELDHTSLWRLDTTTGLKRLLSGGAPAHAMNWALDPQGRARALTTSAAGRESLYYRPQPDGDWRRLYDQPVYSGGVPNPLSVDKEGRLYLLATGGKGASDTQSLLRMDPASLPPPAADAAQPASDAAPAVQALPSETLIALEGYDFNGGTRHNREGDLIGADYLTDARGSVWFDKRLAALQVNIDKLLPGTNNRLDCGECDDPKSIVVTASSDRSPPVYYLYDVGTAHLARLGSSRPWIDPRAMADRDLVRVTARDGLQIPVYVTRPRQATGPLPTVVLVHGGPYVRGSEWQWDDEAQFLASRGYLVLQPEFRGSTGFGRRLFKAGWKQWGLGMDDDLVDTTRWAIAKGWADPQRVALAGASYGGYATLMGLVRNPDVFRCGVEWVGVADIDLLYSITWSDTSEAWRTYGMPVLVADREKDAAQIAATSPLRQAARLHQPLLMAYGGADRRVPLDHGLRMRDALKATNPNVEWIQYVDEGHGWLLQANQVDFWTRVEAFLGRNLKAAP